MRLLRSELELVVKSGFIYVPLLYDPDIAREIEGRGVPEELSNEQAPGNSNTVIESEGKLFVKAIDVRSIVANYEEIDKDRHQGPREDYPLSSLDFTGLEAISPNGRLQTIVLKIMPHFIRKSTGLERKQLNDGQLLDLISTKIDIPPGFVEQADKHLDPGPLLRRLNDLDEMKKTIRPLEEGPVTGEALGRWLSRALEAQTVKRQRHRLRREIRERERLGGSQRNHIALLLYIAEKGSFELDGFGFSRIGSSNDYFIFKHTGEYILKDYYGRSYLFPDCRVAVSTFRPFRPIVLEYYKHPFLLGHSPRQEICMRNYDWPDEFTAGNAVRLLEDGINALLFGYDARRRNGYHSLDPTLQYVKTIEFGDYRV
jgi:hypothetical protein